MDGRFLILAFKDERKNNGARFCHVQAMAGSETAVK